MLGHRLVLLASALFVVAACGGVGSDTTASGAGLEGELLVSAAASLTDAFAEVETAFEAANPGVDVFLNLGSSSSLREQIIEGAPADVFASANTSNMDQVGEAGEVEGEAEIFVLNELRESADRGARGQPGWCHRTR